MIGGEVKLIVVIMMIIPDSHEEEIIFQQFPAETERINTWGSGAQRATALVY